MASPLMCASGAKAALEAKNGILQIDTIAEDIERGRTELTVVLLREYQSLAIQGIYPCQGGFRDARVKIRIDDGKGHQPPEAARVSDLVVSMVEATRDRQQVALWRSAYALWRLNWIHPFRGGNGRTARACSYFILCADLGYVPHGNPTVPEYICERRDQYIDALKNADASVADMDSPSGVDISDLEELLDSALRAQLFAGYPVP